MAFQSQKGILPGHPFPIVFHRHQPLPGPFEANADPGGAGVHRVLHELLHHACRAFHYLARGDAVGDLVGKHAHLSLSHAAFSMGDPAVRRPATTRSSMELPLGR